MKMKQSISKKKIKSEAAIASSLSAKIYKLKILATNIENEKGYCRGCAQGGSVRFKNPTMPCPKRPCPGPNLRRFYPIS